MTEPKTQTLELPGAALTYDVRVAKPDSSEPVLMMIGSPMDASGFTTLASHFRDRAVVTYDPRGVGRSPLADGLTGATPEEHAEDLHRLISELNAGRWTSSPAAGERSTRSRWWPGIRNRSARSSPTSRRWRRCSRTGRRCWL